MILVDTYQLTKHNARQMTAARCIDHCLETKLIESSIFSNKKPESESELQ